MREKTLPPEFANASLVEAARDLLSELLRGWEMLTWFELMCWSAIISGWVRCGWDWWWSDEL